MNAMLCDRNEIKWPKGKLGFGFLRLPQKDGAIDIECVKRMADEFLASGFTYFDVAYAYPGSEKAFREAVVKRYDRKEFVIATKMSGMSLGKNFGPAEMFGEQLVRCGVDYFDFYLIHSVQPKNVSIYENFHVWDFCRQMKKMGKIKYYGFSFHGGPELLDQLLTEYSDVDFVQLQINYFDWNNDIVCSDKNYEVARKHGKPIVVMEPVKGGLLATLKPELAALLAPDQSPASYALRFSANLPGVMMTLSGMSNEAQMADNLATFTPLLPLSGEEMDSLAAIKAGLLEVKTIGCTACRYCCTGCPRGINIPEIFRMMNELTALGEHNRPYLHYESMVNSSQTARASACIACGHCENVCPQHLSIIENLKKAAAVLDQLFLKIVRFTEQFDRIYVFGTGMVAQNLAAMMNHGEIKFCSFIVSDGFESNGYGPDGQHMVQAVSSVDFDAPKVGVIIGVWRRDSVAKIIGDLSLQKSQILILTETECHNLC